MQACGELPVLWVLPGLSWMCPVGGDTGANGEMSSPPLSGPLSFPMALKHRLDRKDGSGRAVLGPGGLVWLHRGEDFGGEVQVLLIWGPNTWGSKP